MKYIIDSYAWVEYFIGSSKGNILRDLFLEEKNKFYTLDCCLAEIYGWALKNSQEFSELLKIIKANSEILISLENVWISSGKERFEQKKQQKDFGLIDSVILVKQKELGCKIITGDKHFKNFKNIIFLS